MNGALVGHTFAILQSEIATAGFGNVRMNRFAYDPHSRKRFLLFKDEGSGEFSISDSSFAVDDENNV